MAARARAAGGPGTPAGRWRRPGPRAAAAPGPPARASRPPAACRAQVAAYHSGRPRGLGTAAGPGRPAPRRRLGFGTREAAGRQTCQSPGSAHGRAGAALGPWQTAPAPLPSFPASLASGRSDRPLPTGRLELGVDNGPRTRPGGGAETRRGPGAPGAGVGAIGLSLFAPGPRPHSPSPPRGPSTVGAFPAAEGPSQAWRAPGRGGWEAGEGEATAA